MDTSTAPLLASFLPMYVAQIFYAVFAAQIARRTGRSVPAFAILCLVPFVGTFFFVYVLWSTGLYVLDTLNALKAGRTPPPG